MSSMENEEDWKAWKKLMEMRKQDPERIDALIEEKVINKLPGMRELLDSIIESES